MKEIVVIIQARMGSKRLPGKVLANLGGKTMLERVVQRVESTQYNYGFSVVIATTTNPLDDIIVSMCHRNGWNFYRGSEHDVLSRYYEAAQRYNADIVIRITADCPLVDPGIIGQIIEEYFKDERMDYVSNVYPQRMFPRGLDVELFTFKALEEANKMDFFKTTREHVTSYIKNTSKFNVLNVTHPQDYSSLRWTVDTVEDYKLLKLIYEELARKGIDSKHVDWIRIVRLMMKNPSWFRINNRVRQKNTY